VSIFETVMKRVDSWVNQITGVSATGGRNAFTFTGSGAIDDGTLTDLYEENPIIARIVDAVPDEGTRQGFSITGLDTAQSSLVNGLLDDLGLGAAVAEAWAWGRLYGGALIFVGADDGMPVDTPLDADRVRALRFLRVVEKQYAFPDRYVNDPTSATHGDVERWRFHDPETGRVSLVHRSRVIRFDGVRTSLRRRRRNNGWAHSEVRRVLTVLSQYEGGWASALTLLNDASQGVFSINDLFAMLASDKNDLLRKRLQFMDETRSVSRSIMLDANSEKYERVETGTLAGLPGVLDGLTLKLAQAARIPVTILMGQAPAGLNATGDSDIRWFYDRIRTEQINVLKPRLERIVRLAMRAQGVTEPESWGVNFASLYQLTDSEKTDMRSKQSAIDVAYINAQVLTPEEVRASRFRPEGYSTETSIDDDSTTGPDAGELGDVAAGVVPEDALAVVKSVAAREIPRDSGLQAILAAMPGLAIEQAERIMGEAGKTFFTTPDPLAQPELEQLRAENAALKRSVHGLKTWNSRIVQRARDGGLELGGLVSGERDLRVGRADGAGHLQALVEDLLVARLHRRGGVRCQPGGGQRRQRRELVDRVGVAEPHDLVDAERDRVATSRRRVEEPGEVAGLVGHGPHPRRLHPPHLDRVAPAVALHRPVGLAPQAHAQLVHELQPAERPERVDLVEQVADRARGDRHLVGAVAVEQQRPEAGDEPGPQRRERVDVVRGGDVVAVALGGEPGVVVTVARVDEDALADRPGPLEVRLADGGHALQQTHQVPPSGLADR